ncbi:aldose epimerase family protein [Parvularcula oceani]|uniref:aldose epimerase family protein n=1 Tax=Parvularcula oceani TaxID=1247963 RepID=UPI0004E1DFE4|nr:aldose epimerase family protein [Parvularcula oceani]
MRALIIHGALMMMAGTASAAEAEREAFGTLDDGRAVEAVVLSNGNGIEARIITLGATLQSLKAPDADGEFDDIVLGYDDAASYLANPQYFGATIGRYANRIAEGRFELDGETYDLIQNEGTNTLHGGTDGFDKRLWTIADVEDGRRRSSVTMTYESPAGEMGFPGTLTATVTYTLTESNELRIEHEATTDAPTIVNLTNHSFFNLSGHEAMESVLDQELTLVASRYTPVNENLIPTGEVVQVEGTPFDFTQAMRIGDRIRAGANEQLRIARGYDHNFVLDGRSGRLRLAARVEDPVSGRVLEVLSDQPAIQFYSGNFLDGTVVGKADTIYRQGDGLCLEPQTYPNSPNEPDFPSARLDPGETYRNVMVVRMSAEERGGE